MSTPSGSDRLRQIDPVLAQPCDDSRMEGEPDRVALLTAIADGDSAAFTEFYDLTSPRVFGLAYRVVRDRTLAEDVVQEVFLQVWSSAARQCDPALASPIGWLMTLTHRRNHAYGASSLGREHDTVADEVGQRLDEQEVTDCLDGLTAVQREAIGLAYYSGHTYREVAEHLAVTLPTIKARIRDGLIRLTNCLGVGTDA